MASFDAHEQDFKIFSSPFDIDADLVPEKYQIELKELQCTFHYYPVHNILWVSCYGTPPQKVVHAWFTCYF